jgi:5'-nucleotidase
VNASPAQAVQHGIVELADRQPSLVASGINYGENVGVGVTGSGTVGAALEGASFGVPSLAISLEVDPSMHINNDPSVDFSAAIHFTHFFAQKWLSVQCPPDVDVLKIDVPMHATPETPWQLARLERARCFVPTAPLRRALGDEGRLGYIFDRRIGIDKDSDAAVVWSGRVAVTPLQLDITSRVEAQVLQLLLNGDHSSGSNGHRAE